MPRRKRDRTADRTEAMLKAALGLLMLLALAIGGVTHFGEILGVLVKFFFLVVLGGAVVWVLVLVIRGYLRERATESVWPQGNTPGSAAAPATPVAPPAARRYENHGFGVRAVGESAPSALGIADRPVPWDARRVRQRLEEIDWYQFEKFCAALLQADGFAVERRGGAQPDGGVDLVVEKQGVRALIQCKHWRTWTVQEKVVRELLGSMTHFGVTQGALYTLKGWTHPAADFAEKHAITLVNGDELAASAALQLSPERLEELLDATAHHCPKCESPMVWREGDFTPFWGCSRFPRCRGKLKYSGAR